jgi:hypothetical protein
LSGLGKRSDGANNVSEGDKAAIESEKLALGLSMEQKRGFAPLGISKLSLSSAVAQRDQEFGGSASLPRMESMEQEDISTGFYSARGPREFKLSLGDNIKASADHSPHADSSSPHGFSAMRTRQGRAESVDHGNPRTKMSSLSRGTPRMAPNHIPGKTRATGAGAKSHPKGERKTLHITPIPTSLGSPRHSPRNAAHGTPSTSAPVPAPSTNVSEPISSQNANRTGHHAISIPSRKLGALPPLTISSAHNTSIQTQTSGISADTLPTGSGIEVPMSHLSISVIGSPRKPIPIHSPRHASNASLLVVEDPINQTGPNRTPSPVAALLPGGSPRIVTDSVFDDLVDSPTSPPLSRRSFVMEDDDGNILSPNAGLEWGPPPPHSRYHGNDTYISSDDEANSSARSDGSSTSGDSVSGSSSSAESTDSTSSSSSCSNSTDSTSDSETGSEEERAGVKNIQTTKRTSSDSSTHTHRILDPNGVHLSSDSDEDAAGMHNKAHRQDPHQDAPSQLPKPRYQYKQGHASTSTEHPLIHIGKPKAIHINQETVKATGSSHSNSTADHPQNIVEHQKASTNAARHSSPSEYEPSPLANSRSPYLVKQTHRGKGHRKRSGEEQTSSGSDSEGDHHDKDDDAAYDAPNEGSPRSEAEMRAFQRHHQRGNISSPTQTLQSPRSASNHFSPRFTVSHNSTSASDSSSPSKRSNRPFTTHVASPPPKTKGRSRGHSFPTASSSDACPMTSYSSEATKQLDMRQSANGNDSSDHSKELPNDSASDAFTGSTDTPTSSLLSSENSLSERYGRRGMERDGIQQRPRARSIESIPSDAFRSMQMSQSFGATVERKEMGSLRSHLTEPEELGDAGLHTKSQQEGNYEYDQDQGDYDEYEEDEEGMYYDDEVEDDENDYDLDDEEVGEDTFDDEFEALSISPGSSAMMAADGGHGEDLYHPIDFETISLEELIREHNRNPDLLYMIEVADPTLMAWLCSKEVVKKMAFALSDQFSHLQLEDTGNSGRNYEKEILSSFTYYLITSPNGSVPNFILENFELLDLFFLLSYAPGFRASPDWTRVMLFLLSRGSASHLISQYMSSALPNFDSTFSRFLTTLDTDIQKTILNSISREFISRGEFALNALLRLIGNDNVARLLAVLILPEDITVPWVEIMANAQFVTLIGRRFEALHCLPRTDFSKHQSEAANLTELCGLIISKAIGSPLSMQLQSQKFSSQLVQTVCKRQPHPLASYCLSIMCHIFDISYNNGEYESITFAPIIAALLREDFKADEENFNSETSNVTSSSLITDMATPPSLPLEYLAYQLENPTLQVTPANQLLNPARQPFGLYRLHLLKSVNSLLKTNYGVLHREMFRTGLVTSVMNAMFRHATGSLIHLNVADTIGNVMYFERTEWLLDWLVKFDFIEKVANAFEAAASHLIPPMSPIRLSASSSAASLTSGKGTSGTESSKGETDGSASQSPSSSIPIQVKVGSKTKTAGYCEQPEYAPHLVSICIKLDRLASSVAALQEYLSAHPRWHYLFTNFVEPLSKQYRELSDVTSLRRTTINSIIAY